MGAVGQHFFTDFGGRIVVADLRMRNRNRAGESRRQLELEFGQALQIQRAAKAHHGWLADAGLTCDFNDWRRQHRTRVLQHPVGHLALGRAHALARLHNGFQNRRAAGLGPQLFRQHRRNAEEYRIVTGNQEGRNLLHVIREAALVFKPLTEQRAVEQTAKARHNATAQINSAQCAQCQRHIAGHRAQHGAEGLQHILTQRIPFLQCATADFGGTQWRAVGMAAQVGQRLMHQFQPGAGQQAFGGNVRMAFQRIIQNRHLALVARGKAGMSPFTAQRNPAVFGGNHAGHAQPGAGTKQADHAVTPCHAVANLAFLFRGQMRQCHRQRSEIVDHQQGIQTQFLPHRFNRKGPVMIGHADLVAIDRIGNRQCRMAHLGTAGGLRFRAVQIGPDCRLQGWPAAAGYDRQRLLPASGGFKNKTGIGAANIGQQARPIRIWVINGGGKDGCSHGWQEKSDPAAYCRTDCGCTVFLIRCNAAS